MDAITAMNNFNQTIMAGAQMIQANKSSKADRKMVQRENEKSRQWNAEMWQKQNEYNTPSAQIGRLIDAGLNPALAYGDITGALAQSVNGSYAPASTNPHQGAMSMVEAAKLFQQQSITNSQVELNQSQAEANQALADKYRSETTGQNLSNSYESQVLNTKVSQALQNLRGTSILNDITDFERTFTYFVKGIELESYHRDYAEGYNYFFDKRNTELGILKNTLNKIYADEQYITEAKNLLGYNAETGRITANAMALNASSYAFLVPYLARQAAAQAGLFDAQKALTDKQTNYFEVGVLKTLTEAYDLYQKGQLTEQNIANMIIRNFNLEYWGQEEHTKGGIAGSGLNIGNVVSGATHEIANGITWLYNMLTGSKQ